MHQFESETQFKIWDMKFPVIYFIQSTSTWVHHQRNHVMAGKATLNSEGKTKAKPPGYLDAIL